MQVGSLGDVVFEVSSACVRTVSGVQFSREARYEEHQVQGAAPRPEYLSPGLGTGTLTMLLRRELGVDPLAEAERLRRMMDDGEVARLVLANANLGKWTIRRMSESWQHMLRGLTGPQSISLTVEITEYF